MGCNGDANDLPGLVPKLRYFDLPLSKDLSGNIFKEEGNDAKNIFTKFKVV